MTGSGFNALVREGAEIPPSAPPPRLVGIERYFPQWEKPDFYAEPWEDIGEECIKFYGIPVYVYTKKVPEASLLRINSISYSVRPLDEDPYLIYQIPLSTKFKIDILRDHITLLSFVDRAASVLPVNHPQDYGQRFCLAAHHKPLPVYIIFDRVQTISVRVAVIGQYPYTTVPGTPLAQLIRFRVLLSGYRSTLTASSETKAKQQRIDVQQTDDFLRRALSLFTLRGGRF